MYCSNCGAQIGDNENTCPYCGNIDAPDDGLLQKDMKIQDLEQKINTLESIVYMSIYESNFILIVRY